LQDKSAEIKKASKIVEFTKKELLKEQPLGTAGGNHNFGHGAHRYFAPFYSSLQGKSNDGFPIVTPIA